MLSFLVVLIYFHTHVGVWQYFEQFIFILITKSENMNVQEESQQVFSRLGRKMNGNMLFQSAQLQKSQSAVPSMQNHKLYFSPQCKKTTYSVTNGEHPVKLSPDYNRVKKLDNMLFTIQENHYFRKKSNIMSPRPPKYRSPVQRTSFFPQIENSECSRQREKRVVFTENLIKEVTPPAKKQSFTSRPIIKRSLSIINDNLSCSSRSLSVQNSFISQLRGSNKKQRPRADSNRQKFAQIMSHFESVRDSKSEKELKRPAQQVKVSKQGNQQIQKYSDSLFPPVASSLFLNPSKQQMVNEIGWRRISECFEDYHLILLGERDTTERTNISKDLFTSFANESFVLAVNALKYSRVILERIFEGQVFNPYGLYLTKIFQQNNWKSIILDDFIPIRVKGQKNVNQPVFINVRPHVNNSLQIWPFLLEKAYSNYYSAYEMMCFGNAIDFVSEITGLVPVEIVLKKRSEKQLSNLRSKLELEDSFVIGQSYENKKFSIIRSYERQNQVKLLLSEYPTFIESELNLLKFQSLKKYYLYAPKLYHTLSVSTIGKYSSNHKNQERSEYSLRKLIVYENGQFLISIQQKQSRFFWKSSLKYSYMWVRAMLVQREYNGYQWIQGNYSNSKSIVLSSTLAPGQYYLIIMPEWKQSHNFQLSLLVWGNHYITIQREKSNTCDEMIEHACMDLAQRKGKINQLSSTLCSYNYLCPKTGLIIENINNQKLKEEITVHRKISGIPCSVQLLPINKQFWQSKGKLREQIDIKIPNLSSFTIVLRMKGGLDSKLIKLFSNEKQK